MALQSLSTESGISSSILPVVFKDGSAKSELSLVDINGVSCVTPQQLANILNITPRGITKRALKEGWKYKEQPIRGGQQRLYPIKKLSKEIQNKILNWMVQSVSLPDDDKLLPATQTNLDLPKATELKDWQRDCMVARLSILNEIDKLKPVFGLEHSILTLVELSKSGTLEPQLQAMVPIANSKVGKNGKRALSRRSIYRWKADLENNKYNNVAVAPKIRPEKALPPWAPYLLKLWQRPQQPKATECRRELMTILPEEIEPPSYDQVIRFINNKLTSLERDKGRFTGSALASKKFYNKRNSSELWPMQEVHADGWSTHFSAPHPATGKFVKWEIWHYHDVATRRVFPPAIDRTENFMVVSAGLRRCIEVGGIPAILQTDNTSSVKGDRFEFDPVSSIQARAGITIKHPIPGNSQANGIAENFNKHLDKCAKKLVTFTGKDMDPFTANRIHKITQKLTNGKVDKEERKALVAEAERVGKGLLFDSFDTFVSWINQVFEDFNDRPHRSLPKVTDTVTGKRRHQTPNEAWQVAIDEGWQPVTVDNDELADLFRPHERRTVQRGYVRIFNQHYHHAELDNLNGQEVQVAYELMDGSKVWVKDLEGRLICIAPFYKSRGHRAQSAYEIALGKRADAAIKRHLVKVERIEEERPQDFIEVQSELSDEQQQLADQQFDALISANQEEQQTPLLTSTENGRPVFLTDADKFHWLQASLDTLGIDDEKWLDWYEDTSEFQLLFGTN